MSRSPFLLFVILAAAPIPVSAQSDTSNVVEQVESLGWVSSPQKGQLGGIASIRLGNDLRFLGTTGTNKFLELNGNPPQKIDGYTLAPRSFSWFAVFNYDDTGHVADDEKIDPAALLQTLKAQNAKGIEERKRLGYPPLYLEGWFVEPHYDVQTKRLEWGTRLRKDDGQITVNYTTRILGRTGVMRATLVSNPETLQQDVQEFKTALNGFDFSQGQRYAEFREGDKVAAYGLGALVVGGAAAAVAKSGAGKGLVKLLGFGALAAGAAMLGFIKHLFGRKKVA